MRREFAYPVILTPDHDDGGFVVRFPDLPEAITQGEDELDALEEATDALDEALAGRIRRGDEIPRPSERRRGQQVVLPTPLIAAKAALYLRLRTSGLTKSDLARTLNCDVREVRRLLDPKHPSKLPRLVRALAALGGRLELMLVEDVA
ncbi:MAG TPA: type II toxin-antitoxin system HicB family antitoxin [Thermoanaerobaculia bacterium]|jgi:antitoxin HicB